MKQMNLYIINNILCNWGGGMVVIASESKEQCREFFIKEFGNYGAEDFDSKHTKFIVIEGVDHPAGIVSFVFGSS